MCGPPAYCIAGFGCCGLEGLNGGDEIVESGLGDAEGGQCSSIFGGGCMNVAAVDGQLYGRHTAEASERITGFMFQFHVADGGSISEESRCDGECGVAQGELFRCFPGGDAGDDEGFGLRCETDGIDTGTEVSYCGMEGRYCGGDGGVFGTVSIHCFVHG